MIRRSTAIWLLLASIVGFSVFQLKHEVQALDDELNRLNRAILAEQQAIHVLRAEWSYLNQPAKLMEMSRRHLDLQPMQPDQLARIADLPHAQAPAPMGAGPAPSPSTAAKAPAANATRPPASPRASEVKPAAPPNQARRAAPPPAQADAVPVGNPRGAR